MGHKSAALIVIVVFGVLFSMLYLSQVMRPPSLAMGIETRPTLTEDDVSNISKTDIEKKIAPTHHVDKFVLFPTYYGHPLSLIFIHGNGTLYNINSTNGYTIYNTCTGDRCVLADVNELLRDRLFYIVDGSWQDSSVGNCSPFIYAVDAKSGEILWSYVGDVEDNSCIVRPPDW